MDTFYREIKSLNLLIIVQFDQIDKLKIKYMYDYTRRMIRCLSVDDQRSFFGDFLLLLFFLSCLVSNFWNPQNKKAPIIETKIDTYTNLVNPDNLLNAIPKIFISFVSAGPPSAPFSAYFYSRRIAIYQSNCFANFTMFS